QLRTSDEYIYALGECAEHRGKVPGLVDPVYEQARLLADVLTEKTAVASYAGSRVATSLKVLGVQLTVMGETLSADPGCEVVSHLDPARGVYRKLILRNNRLEGAILLGEPDTGGRLQRLFKSGEELPSPALELLEGTSARDALLE